MSAELRSTRPQNHESTLVLTLSNPGARNALHPDMYAAAIAAFDAAERDNSLRAIILTGADNFFCAGGNLNRLLENRSKDPSVQAASIDMLAQWATAMRQSSKIVMAAVEGAAAGAGFSLALAADLLVAADDAKFVMAYSRVGLTPDGGGSWFLARSLPRALAFEVMVEGKPIGAQRLADLGVVNRVAKPQTALDTALAWAADLAKISPNAAARIKGLTNAAGMQSLDDQLIAERESFVTSLHHRDGLEGITAFLEKRQPVYK
ncbi:oxepin-CoA hydrolase, alternative type [Paraburkholderia silviterrae]|uniref:Enoyl-CoA hydratase n=1 Tax=Paraburkholderia silviterrae TaxID=2528715 RepID=A0A4R5LZH1_9BURK|nr:enoyl-CoA hydratase [Paraburkholderia silviterrae]TDG18041.1 enoyl-CoA hydratase [Paraburkholderia silviterrae]